MFIGQPYFPDTIITDPRPKCRGYRRPWPTLHSHAVRHRAKRRCHLHPARRGISFCGDATAAVIAALCPNNWHAKAATPWIAHFEPRGLPQRQTGGIGERQTGSEDCGLLGCPEARHRKEKKLENLSEMSKHHTSAASCCDSAAMHHKKAAKHLGAGRPEKALDHAVKADALVGEAIRHTAEANRRHPSGGKQSCCS